jgi:hypothetical protein
MSSGARHGLGVVIGLVVTPVIAACAMYSTTKFSEFFRFYIVRNGGDRWLGAAVLVVGAVLVGVVVGSRVSPLASLIPGFVYTTNGVLWLAAPRWTFGHAGRDLLPRDLYMGYTFIGPYGFFLLLGVAMLAASLPPSRWKAATGAAPRFAGPPPAPMGPPPPHGSAAPLGAPQPPSAPGQSPPWHGAPQYGQPPAQPASASPPAPPSSPSPPPSPPSSPAPASGDKPDASPSGSGSDDEPPGDWTRMYGGS